MEAGQFSASYRVFRADLSKVFESIIADRVGLIWLLLLTAIGTAVRVWFLNQPMRYDETLTYLGSVAPGVDRLFFYRVPNNHVAHSLLVYLSTSVLGGEPWAIRLPAFAAGVLLMPMTYFCARTVFHRAAGLLSAGLVAGSPFLVLFSTNARGYSGIALITLALIPLTLYFVRSESGFAGLLVALLSALGLYTIPVMLFPIAMLGVWSFLLAYQAGGLAKTLRLIRLLAWVVLLCALATAVLYAPVVLRSGIESLLGGDFTVPRPLAQVAEVWLRAVWETWLRYHRDIPGFVQACLGACLLAGVVYLWRANRPALLLLPAVPLGIGTVLLAMRVVPFQRTWIFLLPLGFCLADAGLAAMLRFLGRRARVWVIGALGLLFALGIGYHLASTDAVVFYPETGTLPDAEAIAQYLEPRLQEGDWVLARKNMPLRYYFGRLGMPREVFRQGGDGDIYVVVRYPAETFERVTEVYGVQLDGDDFRVERFPAALLYLPRGPAD
jgi:hypothetical protein